MKMPEEKKRVFHAAHLLSILSSIRPAYLGAIKQALIAMVFTMANVMAGKFLVISEGKAASQPAPNPAPNACKNRMAWRPPALQPAAGINIRRDAAEYPLKRENIFRVLVLDNHPLFIITSERVPLTKRDVPTKAAIPALINPFEPNSL